MTHSEDILANIEVHNDEIIIEEIAEDTVSEMLGEEAQASTNDTKKKEEIKIGIVSKAGKIVLFITRYSFTFVCIFGVLLVAANYKAYWNIAQSYLGKEQMEVTQRSIIESVHATKIETNEEEVSENADTFSALESESDKTREYAQNMHSLAHMMRKANNASVDLDIKITPYENRIVIPKIGRNIPLLDIDRSHVDGVDQLNNIFMKELEKGVIRYPGSAKPGNDGNAFIFGHSSNFPWMKGQYNDVFSLLDNVVYDDEIIVYYGQEKYIYKINGKEIIKPGEVDVIKSKKNDKSRITLMTCWPIGTTINRLIVTGDLIAVE